MTQRHTWRAGPRGRIPRGVPDRPRGLDRRTWLALVMLALVLLWIPVATGLRFPSKLNERDYHVPAVLSYVDHFPGLGEMRDTRLSMLPVFHGVLGGLARLTGESLPALRSWMLAIGLLAIVLYGAVARSIPGDDWRTCVLTLAAFPYFGAAYFVVLTEGPGFLAVAAAILWQLRYWETEETRWLWPAALAGAIACLVRQNLIVVPAVFAAATVARAVARRGVAGAWRTLGYRGAAALLLPASALVFQVWLWRGVLPPFYQSFPDYYEPDATTYLRSILSVCANVGYYLLPATLTWAVSRRRRFSPRIWSAIGAASVAGTWFLERVGAGVIVNTEGLFHHALYFLGHHASPSLPLVVVALSLFSFSCVLAEGIDRAIRSRSGGGSPEPLVLVLLVGALLALAFGLATIYERHIMAIYALAALAFLATRRWSGDRVLWWGWGTSVAFGVAHGIIYAATVYELVPAASRLYELLGRSGGA